MNVKPDVEELLRRACREHREELTAFGPDFGRIEAGALAHAKAAGRTPGKRRVWVRTAAITAAAVLLVNGVLVFSDFAPVRAYRTEIRKLLFSLFNDGSSTQSEAELVRSSNEIRKLQQSVPFTLPEPSWLPPSFRFDQVTMTEDNDTAAVYMKYSGEHDDISVYITNDSTFYETNPSIGEGQYTEETVNGYTVFVISSGNDADKRLKGFYYDRQGLPVFVSTSLDKQSLLSFIASLK